MSEYKNFWDFLKSKPKNLASVIIIWVFAFGILASALFSDMSIPWKLLSGFFLLSVAYLGHIRVRQIYDKFKDK